MSEFLLTFNISSPVEKRITTKHNEIINKRKQDQKGSDILQDVSYPVFVKNWTESTNQPIFVIIKKSWL